MIAIGLSNVSLVLGARPIFTGLNWEIQTDQRIGLIGPNGAGKSSLLRILAGLHTPEPGGVVTYAKGVTAGYLAQDPELDENQPALELALAGSQRVMEIEAHLASAEARLSDPAVYNDSAALSRTLERQQTLLTAFDALGGLTYQSRTREVLKGLGLKEADWPTPVGRLSGGQKKLVGLARLIMARPPVLLLDEPDNHLDLAGKAYLERLINGYPGAVVIVSHDRYLLDAVVTHIAHLEQGRLETFAGDYSSYAVET